MIKKSDNYEQVREHYQKLLSEHYTWTFGGAAGKQALNYNILSQLLPTESESPGNESIGSKRYRRALDLGSGSGFQTIPLMKMGYHVVAIDASDALLDELRQEMKVNELDPSKATIIEGDLLNSVQGFAQNSHDNKSNDTVLPFDTIVCMGDTLTHLASIQEVQDLLEHCYACLKPGGKAIFQFRDLTKPLVGVDRFIPVRSDERTVFTCFLEWPSVLESQQEADGSGIHVTVHDLVHVKKGIGAWELCKSAYLKLALSGDCIKKIAETIGFQSLLNPIDTGMVLVVLEKN